MKIAISTKDTDLDSLVDPRFGRAQSFVLLDTDSGESTGHNNAVNLNALQGSGVQAAQSIIRLGADIVLTGHIGPKAFSTLQAAGVNIHTGISGTARDAVEQWRAGKLEAVDEATVQGHWT